MLISLLTNVHPAVLLFKINKHLRRYGEVYFPNIFLSYGTFHGLKDKTVDEWAEKVPFNVNICFEDYLSREEIEQVIGYATFICRHEFDLLGSGPYLFGEHIDWHKDFKSGFRWPAHVIHSRIRKISTKHADMKVPWELSRFHHGIVLSLAWRLSKDEKYIRELFSQIDDWIEKNPVGYGVNWVCSMEVAIRAVNWLVALALVPTSFIKSRNRVFRSLWEHAQFIKAHLEWNGPKADSGANHLLFDLTGLLTLGVFFSSKEVGRKWIAFAKEYLEQQIRRQVLVDGVHFERSISYHRMCLEAIMWSIALLDEANSPFSNECHYLLSKMVEFVSDYHKPSDHAPMIGDDDNGRLFDTGLITKGQHGYLFPQDTSDGKFHLDRFLLDGKMKISTSSRLCSSAYPTGGYFFLKNENASVIFHAGKLGYCGTHSHNDQLSFELSVGSHDMFVDRGTYLYTSDPVARNLFRSTEAHNVLQINQQEQNALGYVFSKIPDHTQSHVSKWDANSIEAEHTGFRELMRKDLRVNRLIVLNRKHLKIVDSISHVEKGDIINWYFHLAKGLDSRIGPEDVRIIKSKKELCLLKFRSDLKVEVSSFPHSPSYGVQEEANVIVLEHIVNKSDLLNQYKFIIQW
ncbi:MAG: alginate lyase family protein [Candidatus Thorarchaeota archaeon]